MRRLRAGAAFAGGWGGPVSGRIPRRSDAQLRRTVVARPRGPWWRRATAVFWPREGAPVASGAHKRGHFASGRHP